MAELIYTRQALRDLTRLSEFLADIAPEHALRTIDLIAEAVQVLERHPFIGRLVAEPLRELVISQGRTGYVALYSYERSEDAVFILSIRHQREAGFQT